MLLEGSLGFFLKEGVDALVQIITCHIVVDYAKSIKENSMFVAVNDIIGDFGKLTFLLDNFDRLAARSTF